MKGCLSFIFLYTPSPLSSPPSPPLPAHRLSLIGGLCRESRFPAAAQGGGEKGGKPEIVLLSLAQYQTYFEITVGILTYYRIKKHENSKHLARGFLRPLPPGIYGIRPSPKQSWHPSTQSVFPRLPVLWPSPPGSRCLLPPGRRHCYQRMNLQMTIDEPTRQM